MSRLREQLANERGVTTVFVALILFTLLATAALAVDVGLWLNTRSEAQRAADAAALAGAGVYMNPDSTEADAEAAARRFAAANYVGRNMINADADAAEPDVMVDGDPAQHLVRVTVQGRTPALFANYLGINLLPVSARATARVQDASAAKCVKPLAIPDLWKDALLDPTQGYDEGQNPIYNPVDPYNLSNEDTGYGSENQRDSQGNPVARYGDLVRLALTDPGSTTVPLIALPISLEVDPALPGQCPTPSTPLPPAGNWEGSSGTDQYQYNLCNCSNSNFDLNRAYDVFTSTTSREELEQALEALYDMDSRARWETDKVVQSRYEDWMDSPRVMKLALFDPDELSNLQPGGDTQPINFNNIVLFWLEAPEMLGEIKGRFIRLPATGSDARGARTGPSVKVLQLVR